jgi:hypothetical protein
MFAGQSRIQSVGLTGFEPATPCPSTRAPTDGRWFAQICADLRKHQPRVGQGLLWHARERRLSTEYLGNRCGTVEGRATPRTASRGESCGRLRTRPCAYPAATSIVMPPCVRPSNRACCPTAAARQARPLGRSLQHCKLWYGPAYPADGDKITTSLTTRCDDRSPHPLLVCGHQDRFRSRSATARASQELWRLT